MRTCSNCGSEIVPGDVFCTRCGTGQAPLENQVSPERGARSAAADGFGDPATAAVGTTLEVATERPGEYDALRQSAPGAGTAAGPEEPAGQAHEALRPNLAGTPSGPLTPGTTSTRAGETIEQKYLRHTRNATVFIAVIVGIATAIALIGVIYTATTLSKLNSQLNGVSNISNCQSQGGTDPNC
jgi:hypothetical protein